MNRLIALFGLLMCCLYSVAQVRVFNGSVQELIEAKDSVQPIEVYPASDDPYPFLEEGMDELVHIFMSETKDIAGKHPDELEESKNLMLIAQLATTAWKGTQYANAKKWRALTKHFQRAFNRSTSKFNYTKEFSFRIKLVNNKGKRFYCDRKAGISSLDLYEGRKPKGLTKEEKEELPDPIPLAYFTETDLLKQFVRELKRNRVLIDLKRGRYACVGMSIELDERTVHKNRIPTARVVVILGARRLRDLRIKKQEVEPARIN
ncbi:MAG: hypothetical protein HWE22_12870 [Flavobacteriales bacterium]|nr:hypothetical protein [Flavobacteriales bacterium]